MSVRVLIDVQTSQVYAFDFSFVNDMIASTSYSKNEVDRKLSAILRLKGVLATKDLLPTSGNEVGDVWIVKSNSAEYGWTTEGKWEELGPMLDLSAYYTSNQINSLIGSLPTGKSIMDLIGNVPEAKNLTQIISDLSEKVKDLDDATDADEIVRQLKDFVDKQETFDATATDISPVTAESSKEATSDSKFSKFKSYYKKSGSEYIKLTINVDYVAYAPIASFGETVFEDVGYTLSNLTSTNNEVVSSVNALVNSHKKSPTTDPA